MIQRSSLLQTIMTWVSALVVIVLAFSTSIAFLAVIDEAKSKEKLVLTLQQFPDFAIDFVKFYECGDLARSNLKNSIYKPETQRQWLVGLLGPGAPGGTYHPERKLNAAQYTPPFCLFMIPWSHLPINQSLITWLVFTTVCGSALLICFLKQVNSLRTQDIALFLVLVLGSPSFFINMYLGQTAFLITGLLACFIYAWLNRKHVLSGIIIALVAAMKPHHTAIMLVMSIAGQRWKTLTIAALSIALLFACSGIQLGWQTIVNYPQDLALLEKGIDSQDLHGPFEVLVCLRAPLSYLLGRPAGHVLSMILTTSGLILSYFIWKKAIKSGVSSFGFALATTLTLTLLTSTHAVYYDMLYLAVPWAMTLPEVRTNRIGLLHAPSLRAWCFLFWLFPLASWATIGVMGWKHGMNWHILWLLIIQIFAAINFATRSKSLA